MKNYLKGIAIGILLTVFAEYSGVIPFTDHNNAALTSSEKNKAVVYYAGIFDLFQPEKIFDFSERTNGNETVAVTEQLTDAEACARVSRYASSSGGKYGAFVPKSLIDDLFTGNNNNGIWIFLGKSPRQDGTIETNFIIKSSSEDYTAEHVEGGGYFRVDAVCPSYCDGMDLNKCK